MEVELSVVEKGEVVLFADGEAYQSPTTIRPAAPAEIMNAHPKCGECMHWGTDQFTIPLAGELPCKLTYDSDYGGYDWKDGLNDYCRHWEAKDAQ